MTNRLLLAFALLCGCSLALNAQTAPVSGRVLDPGGSGIAGVQLTCQVRCTDPFGTVRIFSGSSVTDAEGRYAMTSCIPIPGGSTCQQRSDSFTISRAGYAFVRVSSQSSQGDFFGADAPGWTSVSAASFQPLSTLTSEMLAAGFGASLATGTESAVAQPLPTTLNGRNVKVLDSLGTVRQAGLLFVSPLQVNYVLPAGLALGTAAVSLSDGNGILRAEFVNLVRSSPGIFTADASGRGVPAAVIARVKTDGSVGFEPVARYDEAQGRFVPIPLEFTPETSRIVLVFFGTGWRNLSAATAASVRIGGLDASIEYIGAQPTLAGLDQINVELPRSLVGRGEVDVIVLVDGKPANTVRINIK